MWIYNVENLKIIKVNKAAVEHYGYSTEEFLSMTLNDIRPENEIEKLHKNILENDKTLQLSDGWKHMRKDGTKLNVEIFSGSIGHDNNQMRLVAAIDVTERIRIQENNKKLWEAEQKARVETEETQKRLRFLIDSGKLLNNSLEYKITVEQLTKLITPEIADWCSVEIFEGNDLKRVAVSHVDSAKSELLHQIEKRFSSEKKINTNLYKEISAGKSVFYPNISDDLLKGSTKGKKLFKLIKKIGIKSAMFIPIKTRDKILGVLTLLNLKKKIRLPKKI